MAGTASRRRNSMCKGPETGRGLTKDQYDWGMEGKGESSVRTEVDRGRLIWGFIDHGKDVALYPNSNRRLCFQWRWRGDMLMLSISTLCQGIHLRGKLVLLHFGQASQSHFLHQFKGDAGLCVGLFSGLCSVFGMRGYESTESPLATLPVFCLPVAGSVDQPGQRDQHPYCPAGIPGTGQGPAPRRGTQESCRAAPCAQ